MQQLEEIRRFWEIDAATYDASPGHHPTSALELVESSPWGPARLERMRDVEWAITEGLSGLDRALGTMARYSISAGA